MTKISQALLRAWGQQTDGWSHLLSLALCPLAWLFHALVSARWWLYRLQILKQRSLSVPVVVVGNVMVGGVGKTPLVMALVKHLQEKGWQVGVLSRGYGRKQNSPHASAITEVTAQSSAEEVGDEPLLIAKSCTVPVWVGSDRLLAGEALLQKHPEVQIVICDDGLQHWPLARDLELCVFDERGIGNGRLLPAGPLREPWPRRALSNTLPCLNINTSGRSETGEFVVDRQLSNYALQASGKKRELTSWGNEPIQALAGIAKPEMFFSMLKDKGLNLQKCQSLPDHAQLENVQINPAEGALFCTEKDAVKLWQYHPNAWAVPLKIDLPDNIIEAIDAHLAPLKTKKISSNNG